MIGGAGIGAAGAAFAAQASEPTWAELWSGATQGGVYVPADLTKFFQDRAGTTPVTADGQNVGRWGDQVGSYTIESNNDGNREVAGNSGAYWWSLGERKVMRGAASLTLRPGIFMAAAVRITGAFNDTSNWPIMTIGNGSNADYLQLRVRTGFNRIGHTVKHNTLSAVSRAQNSEDDTVFLNTDHLVELHFGASNVDVYVDGSLIYSLAHNWTTETTSDCGFGISGPYNGASSLDRRMYGMCFRDPIPTGDTLTAIRAKMTALMP
jgi:hypothetical protein